MFTDAKIFLIFLKKKVQHVSLIITEEFKHDVSLSSKLSF